MVLCMEFRVREKLCGQELFEPQTKGEMSDSIVQNWTQQAFECYNIRCNCKKCSVKQENYSFICQMPKVIDVLLKTKGLPEITDFLSC